MDEYEVKGRGAAPAGFNPQPTRDYTQADGPEAPSLSAIEQRIAGLHATLDGFDNVVDRLFTSADRLDGYPVASSPSKNSTSSDIAHASAGDRFARDADAISRAVERLHGLMERVTIVSDRIGQRA